jgi:uncharacterized protein (TIGR03663 family)
MEIFNLKEKQRLYVYLVVLVLAVGIALRAYMVDLRPLFTDEAVHYSMMHDLWSTQPYKYNEVVNFSFVNTLNDALNLYSVLQQNISKNPALWNPNSYNYKNFITVPSFISDINNIFQPYFYIKHLINNAGFKYDPVYHGPFQYYLADMVFNIAGEHSIFLLRIPMVVCSIMVLFFLFLYREYTGKFGLIFALVLVATSPALVYYSNLANYEDYISGFNILGVGLFLLGIRKRNPWIMSLSGVVLLGLMTIKETALVAWFCIFFSYLLMNFLLYMKNRPSANIKILEDCLIKLFRGDYNNFILKYLLPAIISIVIAGIVFMALYSSFGSNNTGIHDGLTSWMYWKNTGASSGHVKEFSYYTGLILEYDFMITFFFVIGAIIILFTSRDRYQLFLCFWAILLWLVYSYIPYKTPWLLINFLIPFAIVAAVGWNILFKMLETSLYRYVVVLFIAIFAINSLQIAIKAKWFDYDDESNKLTYVHPYRDFEEEIKAIYSLSMASPEGKDVEISVAALEYWPLPAYLYGYNSIGYFGGVRGRDVNINAPILINDSKDTPELREYLLSSDVNDYVKIRDFRQRPGVTHTIFVKQSLFDAYWKGGFYKILTCVGRSPFITQATSD